MREVISWPEAREIGRRSPLASIQPTEIVGESSHIRALRCAIHETYIPALEVDHPEPLLIRGERGTGKDLVARYLHTHSARSRKPFVVVNCAEITDELAASRFFGHKRGSFTGALADEPGFFRAADGGTLFLDEVAELSSRVQGQLLRVLENHHVVPVGQTRELPVNVAVVLATNRDLDDAVERGLLRADLYDRFRSLVIRLLPLRERPGDISVLLERFRRRQEDRHQKRMLGFTSEAMRMLIGYEWPGNVRALSRACSLFVIHGAPGAWIDPPLVTTCVPEIATTDPNPKAGGFVDGELSMHDAVRAFQRDLILSRLERCRGNVKAARASLGLTKTTFHRYLKNLGVMTSATRSELETERKGQPPAGPSINGSAPGNGSSVRPLAGAVRARNRAAV